MMPGGNGQKFDRATDAQVYAVRMTSDHVLSDLRITGDEREVWKVIRMMSQEVMERRGMTGTILA
jgi:hypothetical protein